MMRNATWMKLLVSSVSCCAMMLAGCVSTPDSKATGNEDLAHLNKQLANIEENNACTASFQCKVLPVGERACGGASRYIVYSTLNTAQDKAEQLTEKITQLEKQTAQTTINNDCSPVLSVQSLCLKQQCQAIEVK